MQREGGFEGELRELENGIKLWVVYKDNVRTCETFRQKNKSRGSEGSSSVSKKRSAIKSRHKPGKSDD